MNDKEDNIRNFNARIFIKGKCYNFDHVNDFPEPVNDKEITSGIWKAFQLIKNLLGFIQPFNFFSNKNNRKILTKWLLSLLFLSLFLMVTLGLLFNFNSK
jgi:hypothetical protein